MTAEASEKMYAGPNVGCGNMPATLCAARSTSCRLRWEGRYRGPLEPRLIINAVWLPSGPA